MPKLSPETVQICQDLLPYSGSFDELKLAAHVVLTGKAVVMDEAVIYVYSTLKADSFSALQVAIYDRGDGAECRGTPANTGGWTDYFDSIAEMLASHEEACREAQRHH